MAKNMITGHQYAPDTKRYIGPYTFPNNLDKDEVHLPPNTVLDAPPYAQSGKAAYRISGAWVLRADTSNTPSRPEISDYAMLTDDAIVLMKDQGIWTADDQKRLDAARPKAGDAQ